MSVPAEPHAPPEPAPPETGEPQLRTLLLTDLCDSTALVETLGDTHAAVLFRDHDQLVLHLQQRWHGRLIDRSDGLLMLFERPVEGLGFALDYMRGLRELGHARNLDLRARAGLHVGEVLTWHNSEEAVRIGAKPLEVEGLAKPLAARLMALARPGQILLSTVAETLASRAADELEEAGRRLVWKSHGRWRFKGIPQAQEIHEAGEIGLAPLRMPATGAKAWRDLPLWRRPAALVAELLVLAGIGTGLWFATRSEPAIAFAERDWVVMGDVRNLTGQPVLDDSLQQAFRISLEQSRYVNLLGDLQVRDTLTRMQRDAGTRLDRATASEVAVREGARAVILPTIAEVGGRVKVSAEVVDPVTQATVYAQSESGRGIETALATVDAVSVSLRRRLGEAMKDIQQSSEPLPEVATSNLDALRAYALGMQSYIAGREPEAARYYEQATRLDPGFALAYMGLFRVAFSNADFRQAESWLKRVQPLRARLSARESLYLDAWTAEFQPQPALHAPAKWKLLAGLYPDVADGHFWYSWWQLQHGHYESAYRAAEAAANAKNPLRHISVGLMARARMSQDRYDEALALFTRSEQISGQPPNRRHAAAWAAARRFDEADRAFAALKADKDNVFNFMEKIAYRIDRDDLAGAQALATTAVATVSADDNLLIEGPYRTALLFVRGQASSGAVEFAEIEGWTRKLLDTADRANSAERDSYIQMAIAAVRIGQRLKGRTVEAGSWRRLQALATASGDPLTATLAMLLQAERLRLEGNAAKAIEMLRARLDGSEHFQLHVALRDALRDAGRSDEARQQERWMASHRGLAYADLAGAQVFVPMNVADTRVTLMR